MTKSIGIWRSWSLVAGMMIGLGIFTLPALLASYGSYSFIGWGVTGFGALCLALSYSTFMTLLVQFLRQLFVGVIGFLSFLQ
jgi:amino acid transporter